MAAALPAATPRLQARGPSSSSRPSSNVTILRPPSLLLSSRARTPTATQARASPPRGPSPSNGSGDQRPPPQQQGRDNNNNNANADDASLLRSLIGGDLEDNPRWRWPSVGGAGPSNNAANPSTRPPPPPPPASSAYASGLRWPFVGSGFARTPTGDLAERLRRQGVDVDAVMEGRAPGTTGAGGPPPGQQQQQWQQQPQQQWQQQPPPVPPPPPPPPPPPFGFPPPPPGFSASRFGSRGGPSPPPGGYPLPTSDAEARGMSAQQVLGAMRGVQREREQRQRKAQDGEIASIAKAFLAVTAGIVALSVLVG